MLRLRTYGNTQFGINKLLRFGNSPINGTVLGYGSKPTPELKRNGWPTGSRVSNSSIPPIQNGGLAVSQVFGTSTTTATWQATGVLAGTSNGFTTLIVPLYGALPRSGQAAGTSTASLSIITIGSMTANLIVGGRPTPLDISALIAEQVRSELSVELARLDVAVSTRLATNLFIALK